MLIVRELFLFMQKSGLVRINNTKKKFKLFSLFKSFLY